MMVFCHQLGCEIVEMNIQVDHVHLLVKVPPKLSISELINIDPFNSHRSVCCFHERCQFRFCSANLVQITASVKTPVRNATKRNGTWLKPI